MPDPLAPPSPPSLPDTRQAWIVGGGIAGLASAAGLLREGGLAGRDIHLLEAASVAGGCLDAAGDAERGYSMRGSRMFGAAYVLTYELLDGIPSLDDPARSVAEDTFDFWQATPWYDRARLVERGQVVDASDWGLRHRDRADLVKLMLHDEAGLDGRRIEECFEPAFFDANFWWMWASMFGFETWHSAAELQRYLLRFLRLFPDLETMQIIQSTRYNGHDSIVRPLQRWLQAQGVRIETGVEVTDLEFTPVDGLPTVSRLQLRRGGVPASVDVGRDDLVIVTLGSMTAGSSVGAMDAAPLPSAAPAGPAWSLWQRLAAQHPGFGRPQVFCGDIERTRWITFTVTETGARFADWMQVFSGSAPGRGGLVTLKGSAWGLTFHLYPAPAFAGQPEGVGVWWGYGLFPDRPGDHVGKPMVDCSGREILIELFSQLGLQPRLPELLPGSNCIPCLLPYTTSQFMPRRAGDRPPVLPAGTRGLAFVGQYCEIPGDVVYTVEYSVHSARLAVAGLLGLPDTLPPTYAGLDHPNALVEALRRSLR